MKEEAIKNTPLFAELTDSEQRALGKRMRLENYKPGETLFFKGGESDVLYLIKEGWVKLSAGENQPGVANLGPGSLVGETDFFLGQTHAMTARASGGVIVWSLNNADLAEVIAERPAIGLNLGLAFGAGIIQYQPRLTGQLAEIPFLQELSDRERAVLAQHLSPQRYFANDAIYRSGDAPTGIFFLEKGMVRLLGDTDDDYTELASGDAFGEMAVISGKPHSNTAQAANEVVLWQLSPADFAALAESNPSIKTKLGRNLRASLTLADQEYALTILQRLPLFEDLAEDALKDVARLLLLRHIPAGEFVFNQGDPGEALYIVDSGTVEAISDSPDKPQELVGRFVAGDFFGENALLTGKTRSFTTYAATDANLWGLYRTDFDNLLVKYPQLSVALGRVVREQLDASGGYAMEPHLKKIALLGGLSRRQLDELSTRLQARRYQGGSIIYYEGQANDEMYFVGQGQIERWVTTMQGPVLLEMHEQGDFFGEIALLSGKAHPDTAHVLVDSNVWVLTKAEFEDFVQRYPNLALVFNRLLGERLEETMRRMRGAAPQRALPATTGAPPSRPMTPTRGPVMMPPVPVRPVGPSAGFQPSRPVPALPSRTYPAPGPSVHSQHTTAMPPIRPSGPSVHSQHTTAMPPVRPPGSAVHSQHTAAMPPVRAEPSRPVQPQRKSKPGRKVKKSPARPGDPTRGMPHPFSTEAAPTEAKSKPARKPPKPKRKGPGAASRPAPVGAYAEAAPVSRGTDPVREKSAGAQTGQRLDAPSVSPAQKVERSRRSTSQAMSQPRVTSNRRLKRYNTSLSVWFAKRSLLAKIGILGILILLTWLCGISAPSLIINSLAATFEDEGALPGDKRSIMNQMRQEGAVGAMAALPFVETATPTPTETPTPTLTPTPSATPTETPLPTLTPTPTNTPTPTETPTPIFTPTPTNTPRPLFTNTPGPPTETPTPEPTPTPDVDFRLVSVRQLTPCENQGKHHIFIKVQDPGGQGINGVPVKIAWATDFIVSQTETKTDLKGSLDPGRIDFAMFKGTYEVSIQGGTSEVATGITPDFGVNETCPDNDNPVANSLYHISFEVIFERTF